MFELSCYYMGSMGLETVFKDPFKARFGLSKDAGAEDTVEVSWGKADPSPEPIVIRVDDCDSMSERGVPCQGGPQVQENYVVRTDRGHNIAPCDLHTILHSAFRDLLRRTGGKTRLFGVTPDADRASLDSIGFFT
jgi:hypothetical protein